MLLSSAFLAPHRALNGKTAARQTPRTAPVRSVPRVGLCRAQAVQPGSQAPQKASTQQRTLQFQESSNGATPGPIFSPKSVAIIGASERQTSVGYKLLRNILRDGYTGRGALRVPTIMVYAVNPHSSNILGVPAYHSVKDIPEAVDLAVLSIPAESVNAALEECGQKGVRGVLIVSAGFREAPAIHGKEREAELKAILEQYGMRAVGPNCVGIYNASPSVQMNLTFAETPTRPWPVADGVGVMTQSGAFGIAFMQQAEHRGVNVARFCSLGNKTDTACHDLISLWAEDPEVKMFTMYLESLVNPAKFVAISREVVKHKPVVVMKSGRSTQAIAPLANHTASNPMNDLEVDVVLDQAGAVRVNSIEDLLDVSIALDGRQPFPLGRRVAIVTNSGGPAIVTVDAMTPNGLEPASFTQETVDKLLTMLPPAGTCSSRTPTVDMLAQSGPANYAAAIDVVCADPNVDSVIVIFTHVMQPKEEEEAWAVAVSEASERAALKNKPVFAVLFGSEPNGSIARKKLRDIGRVPYYDYPENTCRSLGALLKAGIYRRRAEREDSIAFSPSPAQFSR